MNLAAGELLHLQLETLKKEIAKRAEQTHLLRGKWDQAARQTADEIHRQSKKKKVGVVAGISFKYKIQIFD